MPQKKARRHKCANFAVHESSDMKVKCSAIGCQLYFCDAASCTAALAIHEPACLRAKEEAKIAKKAAGAANGKSKKS